jgi:thiamine-monophosphate kinase
MKLTETKIINKYLKKLTFKNRNSLNLSDDIFYDKKHKVVISKDTYEENLHFLDFYKPERFIKKIFRASVSDIICKGIRPRVYFLSLSLNNINIKWMQLFTESLKNDSKKYNLYLGGGDLVKSKINSITITVLGYIEKNKPILRNNAKKNDDIYVTGYLGDSYLGLLANNKKLNSNNLNYFRKIYREPNLKIKFSEQLFKFANSSIDLSDGLIKDMNSICNASICGANLNFFDLPFSKNAKILFLKKKIKPLDIVSQGDDYEILFTANKKYRKLISTISKKTFTKVTKIGKIVAGKLVKMTKGNKNVDLSGIKTGFIHRF